MRRCRGLSQRYRIPTCTERGPGVSCDPARSTEPTGARTSAAPAQGRRPAAPDRRWSQRAAPGPVRRADWEPRGAGRGRARCGVGRRARRRGVWRRLGSPARARRRMRRGRRCGPAERRERQRLALQRHQRLARDPHRRLTEPVGVANVAVGRRSASPDSPAARPGRHGAANRRDPCRRPPGPGSPRPSTGRWTRRPAGRQSRRRRSAGGAGRRPRGRGPTEPGRRRRPAPRGSLPCRRRRWSRRRRRSRSHRRRPAGARASPACAPRGRRHRRAAPARRTPSG